MYCEEHSTPLPQDLERHKKFTRDNFLDHDKMVSSLEAQLFIFLAKNQKAKRSNPPRDITLCVRPIYTHHPPWLLLPRLQLRGQLLRDACAFLWDYGIDGSS